MQVMLSSKERDTNQPLSPGVSGVDQLVEIIKGPKEWTRAEESLVRWATPELHMDALAKMVDPPDEFDRCPTKDHLTNFDMIYIRWPVQSVKYPIGKKSLNPDGDY
ncbi:hypothetical protein Tco_0744436 [Tanacetum coccineum]